MADKSRKNTRPNRGWRQCPDMRAEHEPEHLRLRSQRMQHPAAQPRANANEQHQSGHPLGHQADMPVSDLVLRKVIVLEGLGEGERLPEPQRQTLASECVD